MCGIAGHFNFDPRAPDRPGAPDGDDLGHRASRSGRRRLLHRRPASASAIAASASSICRTGDQPLSNEDGPIWVVFNGEIYNFAEIRARARGARPSLPHAHRHRGHRPRLRAVGRAVRRRASAACSRSRSGTRRARRLLLVRDRLGVKPLYYCADAVGRRLRLGDQGAARGSGRPARLERRRARRVPRAAVRAGAADDLPGDLEAAAGPPAGGRARPRQRQALLGSDVHRRRRRQPRGASTSNGSTQLLTESVQLRLDQRRAARRLPLRRHRLERRRRGDGRHGHRTGADDVGRLRRGAFNELAYARTVARHLGVEPARDASSRPTSSTCCRRSPGTSTSRSPIRRRCRPTTCRRPRAST